MTDHISFSALRDQLRLQLFDATELGILDSSTDEAERPKVQFVAAELYVGLKTEAGPFVTVAQADAWGVPFSEAVLAISYPRRWCLPTAPDSRVHGTRDRQMPRTRRIQSHYEWSMQLMSGTQSYWYTLSTQSVVRADQRPTEDSIGPFATAQEAEDSPALLLEHARAWLESEESEPYRAMAEDDDSSDYL